MMTHAHRVAWLCALLAAACGGKVAVDGAGAGGGSTSTSTGVGGGDCASLGAALSAAIGAAQSCNPTVDIIQCSGSAIIHDACGCPIVANEASTGAVSQAAALFSAWIATGCGPIECFACPPDPSTTPWGCDPSTMKCVPLLLE